MKKALQVIGIMLLTTTLFSSCKKKDDNSTPAATGIHATLQQGTWKVSLFQEDSTIETSDFTGYNFQFTSNGVATATSGINTTTGTWSAWDNNSETKLALDFGSNSPLDELKEDWDVLEENASVIRLKHISGGNGGTDLLNFEKI